MSTEGQDPAIIAITNAGLTVISDRRISPRPRAFAVPYPPLCRRRIEVCGQEVDDIVDEEDTLTKMSMLGLLRRTAEHQDGYWWYVIPRSEEIAVVSTRMVNDSETWADRANLFGTTQGETCPMSQNGVPTNGGESPRSTYGFSRH